MRLPVIPAFPFLLMASALTWAVAPALCQQPPYPLGIEELSRPDLLPRFKQSSKIGMFSSYDRTGGNDDGFSGNHSFLRKEEGKLVLAEADGPGIIYRIWTPTPTDDLLQFYFDGESIPRIEIKFRDLFTGVREPFLSPVVGYGVGGFFSYVPIPFSKSIKVVAVAERIQFHQINYALYPADAGITTYSGYDSAAGKELLEKARAFMGMSGQDISSHVAPAGSNLRVDRVKKTVQPGGSATLFESSRPGRIVGLRLSPAGAFAGKDRSTVLKIYWDGDRQPAVWSPVGDFFGYSFGKPAVRSLFVGTTGNTNYVYFPMPYDRSAKIELELQRASGAPLDVEAEIVSAPVPRTPQEGKFYSLWRRENPTTPGKPFTFVDTRGRGHVVGAVLQSQGFEAAATPFFEGDDQTTIDGELVVQGTGSEDFFNGGWYDIIGRWVSRVSFALSGCLEYSNALSRTGGYRLLFTDAYPFRESVLLTIEHGPENNNVSTDYAGVTYWYSEQRPTQHFEQIELAKRTVWDPEHIVYRPGFSLPIEGFSHRNMSIKRARIMREKRPVPYLSVRAEETDFFGPHSLVFRCELPAAGKYEIAMEAVHGPDQAIVQLFRNEKAEGRSVDLYASEQRVGESVTLATLEMEEGGNEVFFKLIGKNPESSGLGFDISRITFKKVD